MNYYNEIKERLIKSEIYDKAKDYSKDRHKVSVYFETGKLLSDAGKEYGKNVIKQYAEKLIVEVGKKYNERTLYGMRKFFEVFSNEKLNPLGSKLSWSHYRELLTIKNIDAIMYYIDICEKNNLSKRQLQERIRNHEYDRLSNETKTKLIESKELKVDDLIPNPIVIKSNMLKDNLSEYALKQAILNNIDDFLRQLGIGFTYVGNEYKIKLGSKYNYIDLLLYNIKYKCYVVVELKVTELKKEHTGQIQTYMNYIDKNIKTIEENYTVGIIVCKQDNEYVIKYCSDDRIIAREYELV
jgi:predicted nuclease of restriction endonuclease-like (RecB) superfamily